VTNQGWAGAPRESGWSRLSVGQKVGVVGAGTLVFILGVVVLIGGFGGFGGDGADRPADGPATAASLIGEAPGQG